MGVYSSMKSKNLATLYNLPLVEWSAVQARLEQPITQAPGTGGPNRHTAWLATINPNGSPHLTGVGIVFAEGTFWFETGDETHKARNLARDPRCSLSLAIGDFDLSVDGRAVRVVDPPTVAKMASRWAAAGWPVRVDQTGTRLTAAFSAPSAGPPPWYVYRIVPRAATVLSGREPGGATRFTFD